MIDELLEYNRGFVDKKGYEKFITNKYPDKKIAIVSCMDTRLIELLPAALGIKNGDVKIIKNAGVYRLIYAATFHRNRSEGRSNALRLPWKRFKPSK